MPVLSPHRSTTSSGLSGSYRSTFGSSLESRSYGGGGYGLVSPRISSYASERYSTRTYESSGRSYYSSSRAGSITDDGYSSTSSRRESSTLLESPVRRSLSTASDLVTSPSSSSRASVSSVTDSIADLRSKYSASNYVPAVIRNRSRHRTSDDLIGLPPSSIKDVNSTSPRLNRSPIATSANGGGALGGSSSNRNSLERDGSHSRTMGGANMYETPTVSQLANHSAYDRSSPVKIMGLNGLKNIGNTCFMNSVIQCLSNTRPLLEYVKKEGYSADINTTLSSMKGALIKAFAQVIKELWSEDSTDRVVNTVSLKSQIQRFAPRFMGYSQQDAQEFLRYLLEGLHEDVNRVTSKPMPIHTEIDEKLSDNEKASESWQRYLRRDNSKIVDLFVGQFKSTLKCTHCGHCSVTFDPFWDLSLPIPQKTGAIRLSQCLDSFTREETLDGDEKPTCSKCKERRKCTKSFTIHKFPKILVIHLKRFSPTERFRGKLSVTVDFPLEGLDMSSYASESNLQCRYNLYAVSNHSGTTYSGHYTAYCRHPYSTTWHEYNDSRVSSISSKSVVSGEAYVLFYELDGKISAHL